MIIESHSVRVRLQIVNKLCASHICSLPAVQSWWNGIYLHFDNFCRPSQAYPSCYKSTTLRSPSSETIHSQNFTTTRNAASAMSDDDNAQCTVCHARSTKKCAGCKVRTYCSKACQVKDGPAHKKPCSDLQLELMLARVAAVVQDAYLTFRKNTWDTTIIKIEDRDDALLIHDGNPWDSPQGFVRFPDNMVPDNKRAQLGVLTAWTCDEPYAFMNTLIVKLLHGKYLTSYFKNIADPVTGLNIDTEEISVKFKTVPRKTTAIHFTDGEPHSNWPGYQHTMLRVKSRKSGKRWVLDSAGGEYGIVEVVHEWPKYEENFVDKVVSVYGLGANKRILSEVAKVAGIPTLAYGLVGRVAAALDKALIVWETQNQPMSTLRALNDAAFTEKKASLLDVFDKAVRTFISMNDFADVVRKAKADDSVFTQHMAKMRIDQLSNEANLLMRYPGGNPTTMDRLRENFGPNYTYRDGDEYCLPFDELLRFHKEEFDQPVEQKYYYDEKNKIRHYFV